MPGCEQESVNGPSGHCNGTKISLYPFIGALADAGYRVG